MDGLLRGMEEIQAGRKSKFPPPKLHELYDTEKTEHPVRPGREPCMNYMRFGTCKFGKTCRFDHPARVKNSEDQVLDELKNTGRYSTTDQRDVLLLEMVRTALSTVIYISGVIDQIFTEAAKDKMTGKRFIDSDTSYAILEAVLRLFATDIQLLLDEVCGMKEQRGSSSWLRYGYVIHTLCVHLPNLGQAVVMAMRHADVGATVIDSLSECFEGARRELLELENEAFAHGFAFDPESEGVKEVLQQTETSILKNAYQHSSSMAEVAGQRVEALDAVKTVLNSVEFFAEKGISLIIDPFGSCANTVGTLKSDLDLIVSFKLGTGEGGVLSAEEMGALGTSNEEIMVMFMDALGLEEDEDEKEEDGGDDSSLFRLKDFRPGARVPVIKFYYKPTNLELDLILFHCNDFALLNTQLIRDYCAADPRVRPLEFALKRWVSSRGVGDSTNSTLSSYCWMLMMIFYLQQVDRDTLRLATPASEAEAASANERFLSNLQSDVAGGQEKYTLRPQPELTAIYSEVMSSMPCDQDGQWLSGVIESLKAKEGGIVQLLLGFFLFYGTEAEAAFGWYDNIASMRKGQCVPKPHVLREWRHHNDEGLSAAAGAATIFETPTKAASEPLVLSLADLERQLTSGLKLGDEHPGVDEVEGEDGKAPSTSAAPAVTTPVPVHSQSPPSRAPRAIPSTPQPFSYKDTPSKLRELLEKPAGKVKGVFPDVLDSAKLWQVSVEDPFELSHDLGSVVRSVIGQSHIRCELRRACCILSTALNAEADGGSGSGSGSGSGGGLFEELCTPNEDVPQLPFLCSLCGQIGHREKQCALFVCHRCGQQGHSVRECKEEKRDFCFACNKHGHVKKDCPSMLCHSCGKRGHKASRCPKGRDGGGRQLYNPDQGRKRGGGGGGGARKNDSRRGSGGGKGNNKPN